MDNVKHATAVQVDVETGIFINFVRRLAADSTIDAAAVRRIDEALLHKKEFSVEKLRGALFPIDGAS